MKISHIHIKNYRTFRDFEIDFGDYNVLIGQNNVGKSNLLHAIDAFYTNRATIDDLMKNSSGDFISNVFSIAITYDDLTPNEKQELKSYLLDDDKYKVVYKGILDDGIFTSSYRGYKLDENYVFPKGFNEAIKSTVFSTHKKPKREDFVEDTEALELLNKHSPKGAVSFEQIGKMKEECLEKYNDIIIDKEMIECDTNFQGFVKTKNPDRSGVCIFIPAISIPALESEKQLMNQLVQPFLEDVGIEESRSDFDSFQKKVLKARLQKKTDLETKINSELELWNTTTEIEITPTPIEKILPVNLSILFDDGIKTSLGKKGSGLQRYIFFKTLKILNEDRYSTSRSFIFLFEEPEAHLHPQLQREIFETLRELSKNPSLIYQIILTTHSPQFVDIENLDELYIFNKENQGCTELQKCDIEFTKDKDLVKTILAFSPNISEIFFADHVILIEGQTEEITMNYLSKNGLIDLTRTSIINTMGKYNFNIYINVLNKIGLPYTILIDEDHLSYHPNLEGDKRKEKIKAYKQTKSVVEMIDDEIGHAIILSPDYDNFTGISKHADSKPTKIYNILRESFEINPDKKFQNKIVNLFSLLLNPSAFKHKAIKPDGKEWIFTELME